MNVTKVLLIALIASVSALLTLWVAGGLTMSGWYIPIVVLVIASVISDRAGLGSISEFLQSK
ncbi:hypothetical protein [Vibrio paracholerae]|uniref:hypothetical protein n=1 Tax=Vibrio paracholerae TaxID=650003 RepID=UPI0015EEA1C7|nr:hypothetical protein [Vibrio paracholerae]EGQ7672264.1 hypothetical protein [Vibrio cholerae]ELF3151651.1 hypothetical protein [Vibrio cholerae]ELH5115299.1 hypothetical protein [Vibrio cholerae]